MAKLHIKKGDTVMVLTGNSKGKTGTVLRVLVKEQKATIDAAGTVGEEKFGWRVERDVQGHTNVARQVQGVNGQ